MKGKAASQSNQFWNQMAQQQREEAIKHKHPDELYAICRADNNYWRHYRASTKLGIDELSMMICKEVGCDLSYCQHLIGRPKTPSQRITDCDSQFDAFRQCIIREKKIFRDLVSEQDRKDPMAIPNYLEKHFKQKAAMKKEQKMLGGDMQEMREKIEAMDEVNTEHRKLVDTNDLQAKRKQAMENYI